ncbi:IS66 family transposase [Dyadobacter crusticola]|uniref:IS66 family transposase n=1 Tax=Dyadobacter crusticola TaxID=292407 RepID=UPI0005559B40|nr:transposase [Dyadobacter crusticola]
MLERMQLLYALEKQMREDRLNWEEKTKLRQEESVPVLLELKEWMTQQLPQVIPRGGRLKFHSVKHSLLLTTLGRAERVCIAWTN